MSSDFDKTLKLKKEREGHGLVADGRVISVSGGEALVRLEGTTDTQRAFVSTSLIIAANDRVLLVRSPRSSRWTITSVYDRPDTGQSPAKTAAIEEAASKGGWEVIIPLTKLPAAASSIELNNIGIQAEHLMLLLQLRSNRAATTDHAYMTFNGDTGNNYYNSVSSFYTSAAGAEYLASPHIRIICVLGDTAPAGYIAQMAITFHGYRNLDTFKTLNGIGARPYGTSSGNQRSHSMGGHWLSLEPITAIKIIPMTGTDWTINSRYALYGMG